MRRNWKVISILFLFFGYLNPKEINFGCGIGYTYWDYWKGKSAAFSIDYKLSKFFISNLFGSFTDVRESDREISFYTFGGIIKSYFSIFEAGIGYGFIPEFLTNTEVRVNGVSSPLLSFGLKFRLGRIFLGLENLFILKLRSFYNPSLTFAYNIGLKPKKPEILKEIGKKLPEERPERLPPYLEIVSLNLKDENGDGALDALEKGWISISVRNKGKGNAYNLEVIVSPLENYEDLKMGSGKIEKIGINETKTIEIPISAGERVRTQEVKLRVDVKEPYFYADADPKVISFNTKQLEPPEVKVVQTGIDDDEEGESMGNSNGKIERGETVEITAILQNLGRGLSENTNVHLLKPKDPNIMFVGKETTFTIGTLKPGEWKKITFPVYITKKFEGDRFKLNLLIKEKKGMFTKLETIAFQLDKPIQRPEEIKIVEAKKKEEEIKIEPIPELISDVDTGIPITKIKNKDGIAVIIAGYEYKKEEIPKVEFALKDAQIIKEYLLKTFGFQEENIIFLRNPSKGDFERVFGIKENPKGQLYNYVKKGESDVFIYYTGHGAPNLKTKKGYFVPYDADPSYIELQGYPLELFFENLAQVPAKNITVVIDACFSGAYDKGTILAKASPITGVKIEKVEGLTEKGVIITSCSEDEIASWYPEKKHSLFTYFFLKGLKGEADKDGDKKITIEELASYVKDNVSYWARRLYNRSQNPKFEGKTGAIILQLK